MNISKNLEEWREKVLKRKLKIGTLNYRYVHFIKFESFYNSINLLKYRKTCDLFKWRKMHLKGKESVCSVKNANYQNDLITPGSNFYSNSSYEILNPISTDKFLLNKQKERK